MDNIIDIANQFIDNLKFFAPKASLNLVNNIGYDIYDDNNIEIIIDVPYATNTNEKWIPPINLDYFPSGKKRTELQKRSLKSYRTGGENPNEKWVDIIIEQTSEVLAEINLGVVISSV